MLLIVVVVVALWWLALASPGAEEPEPAKKATEKPPERPQLGYKILDYSDGKKKIITAIWETGADIFLQLDGQPEWLKYYPTGSQPPVQPPVQQQQTQEAPAVSEQEAQTRKEWAAEGYVAWLGKRARRMFRDRRMDEFKARAQIVAKGEIPVAWLTSKPSRGEFEALLGILRESVGEEKAEPLLKTAVEMASDARKRLEKPTWLT